MARGICQTLRQKLPLVLVLVLPPSERRPRRVYVTNLTSNVCELVDDDSVKQLRFKVDGVYISARTNDRDQSCNVFGCRGTVVFTALSASKKELVSLSRDQVMRIDDEISTDRFAVASDITTAKYCPANKR